MSDLDLWGNLDLKSGDDKDPFAILNKQAQIFEKKVKDVLFIRLAKINISDNKSKYSLSTNFEIVSPSLDNYSYTLFTVYSRAESDYPVGIECNYLIDKKKNDDILRLDHECNNIEEFIEVLKKVLQSQESKKIIRTLYNKSI